jgi:hypothetical protein
MARCSANWQAQLEKRHFAYPGEFLTVQAQDDRVAASDDPIGLLLARRKAPLAIDGIGTGIDRMPVYFGFEDVDVFADK